jgi:hypothetical protein
MKLVAFFPHFDELLLKPLDQTRYVFLSSRIVRSYLQNLAYIQFVKFLARPKHWFRAVKSDAVKVFGRLILVTQLGTSN